MYWANPQGSLLDLESSHNIILLLCNHTTHLRHPRVGLRTLRNQGIDIANTLNQFRGVIRIVGLGRYLWVSSTPDTLVIACSIFLVSETLALLEMVAGVCVPTDAFSAL